MNKQTARLLKQHFDTAFAAPDGIKKLRELILTLAMQGRLVPQDPNDQPASELLMEIAAERRRLVKEGKIKAAKPLPEITAEDVPYGLPVGWVWVRLGDIADVNGGFAFKSSNYSNNGVRVVRISDFDEKGFKDDKIVRFPFSDDLNNFKLEPNNILMAMTGGTVGKSLLVKALPELMVVNQRVATIKIMAGLIPEYINSIILTNAIQSIIQSAKNSTNDNISMGDITGFLVPLAPLLEQHRIVAKIDQLMARCDELEKLRAEQEQKRLAVHTSAIKRLLDAQTKNSFDEAWQFITRHFGTLYSVKGNVTELRKAILQLAVMGKLVPQDPSDPPASELLKVIEAEKRRLVKEGKIKKPTPWSKIKKEDEPYVLPESWEWCRVWDIAQLITSGSRDWAKYYSDSGAIFVTMGNLSRGVYDLRMDTIRYVMPPQNGEGSRTKLEENDLLISITGDVGNLGLIPHNFGEAYINQHTCLLRFIPYCQNRYFPELMRSPLAKIQFDGPQRGIKNSFRLGDVGEMIIPLPPLPEQHRIVAKIDQLMSLCDALEQQIDAAAGKQTKLLSALMAQV